MIAAAMGRPRPSPSTDPEAERDVGDAVDRHASGERSLPILGDESVEEDGQRVEFVVRQGIEKNRRTMVLIVWCIACRLVRTSIPSR